MKHYAILCGSAPEGKIQKKIDRMYESLLEENDGLYAENEIMIFPNGIDESTLIYVMNNLRMSGIESVFVYVCTVTPVADYEKTVWLGGNEIRKSLFEQPAALSAFVFANDDNSADKGKFPVQVVYDSCREFEDGGEYYYDADYAEQVWG